MKTRLAMQSHSRILIGLLAALVCATGLQAQDSGPDVAGTRIADVTTRAFSVVWVANEPILDAAVRVYRDSAGMDELTGDLLVEVPSAGVDMAHPKGIVKVAVSGLHAGEEVYVQTATTAASGTRLYPSTAPFLSVSMATETRKANASNQPIVNDLITYDITDPDGLSLAEGALLLVDVPGISAYPLTAFVGEELPAPAALVDMNNVYDADGGISADLAGGDALRLTAYRGLTCAGFDQALVRFRRLPMHDEDPPITELETPVPCGIDADFNCDACVNPADFNEFLIQFGQQSAPTNCVFNGDFDLSGDGRVDPVDFNEFLFAFGICE